MIYIFLKKNNDDFIFLLTMKVKQTQESWQHQGEPQYFSHLSERT